MLPGNGACKSHNRIGTLWRQKVWCFESHYQSVIATDNGRMGREVPAAAQSSRRLQFREGGCHELGVAGPTAAKGRNPSLLRQVLVGH